MNIISNTCLSAILQRDQIKQEYENPFCWNLIDFNSMYYLIKNFETINFNNIELTKNNKWEFSLIIDKNVRVQYVHYKFNINENKLVKKGSDMIWNRIWEYIIEKYNERKNRMLAKKNKPVFIIGSIHRWKYHTYSETEIQKICELCTMKKYKLIVVNKNFDFSKKYPNVKFIKTKSNDKKFGNIGFAKEIYPQIKKYLNL